MAKLERLRRLRDEEGLDPGRGEEFNELYAKERKERSEREESRGKRRKRRYKQELKDVQRVDVESIRDVLRKRLKGEKIDDHYQRYDDKADLRSDKSDNERRIHDYKNRSSKQLQVMKNEGKKMSPFRAKLHELSMSPRTRGRKELESLRAESTQEISSEDKGNLRNLNKTFKTSRRSKPLLDERSKRSTKTMKGSRTSWLFKSPKERQKELIQRQLELRRKVRSQEILSKRQKLISDRKIAADRLVKSSNRSKESLSTSQLNDISTARLNDISTAQTRSSSKGIRKNRKRHQTARNIVEEDLKQRLKQMDFKLKPAKIPKTKTRSESSTTSHSRSSDTGTVTSSSDASVKNSKHYQKSDRRMRDQKSDKQIYANKLKYSGKSSHLLSRKKRKMNIIKKPYHSKSQKKISNNLVTPTNSTSDTINSQKHSIKKSSESKKGDSESQFRDSVTEKIRLKDKKMINNRRKRRKEKLSKMDSLQKAKSKNHENLKKALNHRSKKKIQNGKGIFSDSKEKATKQLSRQKKLNKHSSNIRKTSKVKRNLNKGSNQQSCKIFPSAPISTISSSKSMKLKKDQFDDKNSTSDQRTIKTAKSSRSHTTHTNSNKSLEKGKNEDLQNSLKSDRISNAIIRSDNKEISDRGISMRISGRN